MMRITAIARAEIQERLRRRSFLIITALVLWACFASVPAESDQYSILALGDNRGIYNGAWIGLMFAMISTMLAPMLVFYLVRGSVNRDRDTHLGQVLAASSMTKFDYLAGKALANFCVLGILLAVLSVGAIVMLGWRGETPDFDVVQLLLPIWLMGLPVMATVAAVAVFFETLRWLSRGFGNVLWFFLWTGSMGLIITMMSTDGSDQMIAQADFFGMSQPIGQAQEFVASEVPGYKGSFALTIGNTLPEGTTMNVLDWPDHHWSARYMLERLLWLLFPMLLLGASSLWFDRFRPESAISRIRIGKPRAQQEPIADAHSVAPAPKELPAARFGGLGIPVLAEFKLLIRGQRWWWWAVFGGLSIAAIGNDLADAHEHVQPFLFLWPVLVISATGAREFQFNTGSLLRPSAGSWWKLVIGPWLAGTAFMVLMVSVLLMRYLVAGEADTMMAMLVGCAFVPALSLALANLSGGSRFFEAVYVMIWYVATQKEPVMDFMGLQAASLEQDMPLAYAIVTFMLLGIALGARRLSSQRR